MATNQFLLSECTPTDIPGISSVYTLAFASDPLSAFTFPRSRVSPSAMSTWLASRFLKLMKQREIHSFKIVDSSTGKVCAFLRVTFPHVLSEEERRERQEEKRSRDEARKTGQDPQWPEGADMQVCDEKFGALDGLREKYVVDGEMYVAHLLATDPAYQRKGLASKLLKHVLDIADSEGRKVYIEATNAGHPVYFKLGFRDVDKVEIDLKRWGGEGVGVNRIMIREPVVKA